MVMERKEDLYLRIQNEFGSGLNKSHVTRIDTHQQAYALSVTLMIPTVQQATKAVKTVSGARCSGPFSTNRRCILPLTAVGYEV